MHAKWTSMIFASACQVYHSTDRVPCSVVAYPTDGWHAVKMIARKTNATMTHAVFSKSTRLCYMHICHIYYILYTYIRTSRFFVVRFSICDSRLSVFAFRFSIFDFRIPIFDLRFSMLDLRFTIFVSFRVVSLYFASFRFVSFRRCCCGVGAVVRIRRRKRCATRVDWWWGWW